LHNNFSYSVTEYIYIFDITLHCWNTLNDGSSLLDVRSTKCALIHHTGKSGVSPLLIKVYIKNIYRFTDVTLHMFKDITQTFQVTYCVIIF